MHFNKNLLTLFVFIFFSAIISLLIIKQIIYPTIIPMVYKNGAFVFSDWTAILNANICYEKGYDVFTDNPCDQWNRIHVYGKILLYLPGIKNFTKFYFLIFPIFINLLFLFAIVSSLFTYPDKKKFFLSSFFILSVPVLLVIERSNIDLVIFIFTFFIAKNNNIIVKHFLIFLSTISKFYPLCLSIVFLFEKNFKKIIINILILFFVIFLFFSFQIDTLVKIYNNQGVATASSFGVYEFSFMGFINLFKYLNININNTNYNWIIYVYVSLFVLLPIFITNFIFSKKVYYSDLLNNLFNENTFENKFYILSSTIILICYFTFSNFIHREIFFLGLIPWVLKNEKKIKDNNFLTFYFYVLLFKFSLTSIIVFLSRNKFFPNLDFILIILKHSLDVYIISIIACIFVLSSIAFIAKIIQKYNN